MTTSEQDVEAIKALVARQFASLNWRPGTPADWASFAADFFPEAALYPSARPAKRQTVEGFVERMQGIAAGLRSFHERVLGVDARVFGNVAVAVAACETTENEAEVNRSVEMLLLIKDGDRWRIVAQAWDTESPSKPIPAELLDPPSGLA